MARPAFLPPRNTPSAIATGRLSCLRRPELTLLSSFDRQLDRFPSHNTLHHHPRLFSPSGLTSLLSFFVSVSFFLGEVPPVPPFALLPNNFFPSHKWGLHLSIVCVPTTTRTKKNFEEHTGAGARARAFELLLLLTLSLALVAVFHFFSPSPSHSY